LRGRARADLPDAGAGLDYIFPGMGESLAEWIITAPGGEQMILQMAYFDRTRDPSPPTSARS
jgi:hypothetical protein